MNIQEAFRNRLDQANQPVRVCDLLTEDMLWGQQGSLIWLPKRVELKPSFYPVYKWQDFYSFSLLALILRKGFLSLNGRLIDVMEKRQSEYWGGSETLDTEITRIGGQHDSNPIIKSPHDYAAHISAALKEDIKNAEIKHPGYKNMILCGGKDSLNLLLLPWGNETVVLSAAPNYEFVVDFVAKNKLALQVVKLEDFADVDVQDEEMLLGCCRTALGHWRWGVHLKRIAQDNNFKVVFWKGQVADLYTTSKWKAFIEPSARVNVYPRKLYKKFGHLLPNDLNLKIGRQLQPSVIRSTWMRCAALQGTHMEFLRELTGSLFLSAYHGPAVQKVWSSVDLSSAAQCDMRHLIGRDILGRDVIYPDANPAPPLSVFREGLGRPDRFLNLLDRLNFSYHR